MAEKYPCDKCEHFTFFAGRRGRFGMRVQESGFNGFDGPNGQHYEAIGIGHCEHPVQPRGLVICAYTCPNHSERHPATESLTQIRFEDSWKDD